MEVSMAPNTVPELLKCSKDCHSNTTWTIIIFFIMQSFFIMNNITEPTWSVADIQTERVLHLKALRIWHYWNLLLVVHGSTSNKYVTTLLLHYVHGIEMFFHYEVQYMLLHGIVIIQHAFIIWLDFYSLSPLS